MEDRLAKSLRAAHDRHAQHLNAGPAPRANHPEQHDAAHEQPAVHQHDHEGHQAATAPHVAPRPEQQRHTHAQAEQDSASSRQNQAPQTAAVAASPSIASAPSHIEPARPPVSHGPAFGNRFAWQNGRISIVGTLLLSVLISTGLFSLQLISKWRRPKPAQADAKLAVLEQPLTIAAPNDGTVSDEPVDSPVASTSHSRSAPISAQSDEPGQQSLSGIFSGPNNHDASENVAAGETKANRAPYAPDPIDLSNASGNTVDDRIVTAPEADGARSAVAAAHSAAGPSGLSAAPLISAVPHEEKTAANVDATLAPAHDLAAHPAAESPAGPPQAGQPNKVYGLFDRAGASQQPAGRPSQEMAQATASPYQDPSNSRNVNLVQWNRPAPDGSLAPPVAPAAPMTSVAPAAALQGTGLADAARNSLDAPGPVIMPGRTAAANNSPSAAPVAGMTGRTSEVVQADVSPQLRDLTQPPRNDPAQAGAPAIQTTSGVDPVYGLLDRRGGAASPDVARLEPTSALAAMDRTKVMSFQFRNAPWTVVLSQFAAETHLELRMQAVPQGVLNRMDTARYTPSQTLAILNSELARTACQLKLEGNVLRVCAVAPATAQATPNRPAAASTAPSAWFPPQSSGIAPVSGRY